MNKKVLAIFYTQTGQLEQIVDSFISPFLAAGIQVEKLKITPKKPYAFPWSGPRFFEEMPESVLGIPGELEPFQPKETAYDLIILGWQPWFLSPSVPSNSLLKHPAFQRLLAGTPVVTLTGARNMWLNAQERNKKMLREAGAELVGNVVLTDRHQNYISGVTILHWMFSGKKDRLWGIFPTPGVAAADIAGAGNFGKTVLGHLQQGEWQSLQPALIHQKALDVKWDLMFIEARAGKLFSIWANLVIKKKNRALWLVFFKYYLLIALFIVAPIVVGVYGLLFKPFLTKSINKKKQYYLELN